MSFMDMPQKYYEKEGFLSLNGIGYTAALAVTGLGLVNTFRFRNFDGLMIITGGALATWGYLKASGVLY